MNVVLKLIKTVPREQPDYATIHFDAAVRSWQRFKESNSRTDIIKAVNHGVRAVLAEDKKICNPEYMFKLCELVSCFLERITPQELMQVFPIEKEYDGKKWETKDYYYTMNAMKTHGLNRLIGDGDTEMLLWDYMNWHMRIFQVAYMSAMSDIYRQQTGEGIMERFCREQDIKTYVMHTDPETGKKYLYDEETGQYTQVRKPIPRYMKVLQGGKTDTVNRGGVR